nr:uncharacterized protein LOC109162712 [Ipomoea batatas]
MEGVVRRIGDGAETRIWGTPWLADPHDPRLHTLCIADLEHATVSGLLDHSGTWDEDVVKDLFVATDVPSILATPVSPTSRYVWLWQGDVRGIYTVRHGYNLLTSASIHANPQVHFVEWRKLWKLPVPPKVKNLLWRCMWNILPVRVLLRNRHVWAEGQGSSVQHSDCLAVLLNTALCNPSVKDSVHIAAKLWLVWNARNDAVWKGKFLRVDDLLRQVESLRYLWVSDYSRDVVVTAVALGATSWSPLPIHRLKCNVDATLFEDGVGYGLVITGREASSSSAMEVVAAAHRRRKPVLESLTPSGEGKSVSSTAARHSPKDPSEKTTSPVCWFVDHPFGVAARCRHKEQRKPTPAGVPDSLSDAEEGSSSSRSSDRRASCCFAPTLPWPVASTHRPPLAKSGVADVQEMPPSEPSSPASKSATSASSSIPSVSQSTSSESQSPSSASSSASSASVPAAASPPLPPPRPVQNPTPPIKSIGTEEPLSGNVKRPGDVDWKPKCHTALQDDHPVVDAKEGENQIDVSQSNMQEVIMPVENRKKRKWVAEMDEPVDISGEREENFEGHSGGLACLWKDGSSLSIQPYSSRHIDTVIAHNDGEKFWRFTGFYGQPDRSRRAEGWELLKKLSMRSNLPWVVAGDFNDIMHQSEKNGGTPQPRGLIEGFCNAVEQSGLSDFSFSGHQFTWEKSCGMPSWIQAKLDRILVSDAWKDMFGCAEASSIVSSRSDHLPILLTVCGFCVKRDYEGSLVAAKIEKLAGLYIQSCLHHYSAYAKTAILPATHWPTSPLQLHCRSPQLTALIAAWQYRDSYLWSGSAILPIQKRKRKLTANSEISSPPNQKLWNNYNISPAVTLAHSTTILEAWRNVHDPDKDTTNIVCLVRWKRPPQGWLKVNVDAANDQQSKVTGLGFVLRDYEGSFVAAKIEKWQGLYHPKAGEAIGIRETLKWVKKMGLDHIQVESDAMLVIQGLSNNACISSFDLVLDDIREKARNFSSVSFSFVKRSANTAAHLLAREAVFSADCREWIHDPPSFLLHALALDANE